MLTNVVFNFRRMAEDCFESLHAFHEVVQWEGALLGKS